MKRKATTFFLVLAVFNILIAVIPPCAGGFGAASFMSETKININNRELGPELEKHIAKEAPMAKFETFAALGMNTICGFLLIGGAVGLFMGQGWARWLTVGAALLLILTLLIHDVYQIFFYRPVLMTFIDQNVPAHGVLADGIKWTTTVRILGWSCSNPLIMLYLFVMAMCMALMNGFQDGADTQSKVAPRKTRSRRDEEEEEEVEEEEKPQRRRRRRDEDDD